MKKLTNLKSVLFDFNRTLFDPTSGKLIEGSLIVLESLSKKYPLGLVSLSEQGNRANIIKNLDIEKYFEVIEIVEEKTEEVFLEFCKKVGCKPSQVLVVGDRIQSEITIGNSLGMTTVWFQNGIFASETPTHKNEEPDFIIKELRDLLKLF